MRHSLGRLSLTLLLLGALPSCSLIVEGALPPAGADAGVMDAPPVTACTGRPDGTFCDIEGLTDREICVGGVCVVSACGDGFSDTRAGHPSGIPPIEDCDDGNAVDGDGCDFDCTFSCAGAADCPDDEESCNGVPTCGADHACTSESLPNTTVCTVVGAGVEGTCTDGVCRSGVCPNGVTEPGEDCDDDNATSGDGCEANCTFTCIDDSTCQNATVCDGAEMCDVATHTCVNTAPPSCDDGDPCTADSCDAVLGCVAPSVLVDADMDGFFAVTASCGGDDCNDADMNINPGVVEGCGVTTDLNCDGMVSGTPTWYADCDNDGYAALTAQNVMACSRPSGSPSTCSGGSWISLAPSASSNDCVATNPSAHPGQSLYYSTPATGSSYDYNCDGSATRELPNDPRFIVACAVSGRGCSGTNYWTATTAPACGSMATESYCALTIGIPSNFCTRRTRTSTVRCH